MKTCETINCPQCGSRYAYHHLDLAEKHEGVVKCYVCEEVLTTFNDRGIPVLLLTYRAPWRWGQRQSAA